MKVILHQEDEAEVAQEAQFSISLRHPNVVQTFHYAVRTVDTAAPTPKNIIRRDNSTVIDVKCTTTKYTPSSSSSKDPVSHAGMGIPSSWMKSSNGGRTLNGTTHINPSVSGQSSTILTEDQSQLEYVEEQWLEMWLIQEYCNLGSLGKQNYLRINDQPSAWGRRHPEMRVIVEACKDIARGMKYLHDNDVVHGDLKCDNVLLQTSHVVSKGFTAKVADFGKSNNATTSPELSLMQV